MNSKPVFALEVVAADLKAAAEHYESWRSDGRAHLLRKYEETIAWIAWNPDLFRKQFGAVRRAIIKDSYYLVYFVQEAERSLVVAVLDGRRAPDEIRKMLRVRRAKKR